jgi:RNA polymerase sigma-70 factor (ECF subfamily)
MSSMATPADASPLDHALSQFVSVRPRLFGMAYRMLGSAADADDIVQSAWLRWQTTDRSEVIDPPAFLSTMTARLAINHAASAHERRQTYVGPWLPEPVDTSADPYLGAERGDALELAVLVLLEKLSPKERGAYVLREAFDYPYDKIADILGLEEANVRQLVSRAKKHIEDGRRAPVNPDEQERLLKAFVAAAQDGDAAALEELFASDIVSYSDGGGVVRAASRPVVGREVVAKFIAKATTFVWKNGVTPVPIHINGQAAVAFVRDGVVGGLVTITASSEGIDQIMWMMRPSKLAAVSPHPRESHPFESPAPAR